MIDQTQAIKQILDKMVTLQQVQQFAIQHQDNAIAMALASQRANEIRRIQAAAQGQAGQQPQPTVAQQKMSEMSQLPESTGVATLNPEVTMAGGGIVAFAGDEGSRVVDKNALVDYTIRRAKQLGIDPKVAVSLIRTESNFNTNATSRVGAKGLGQLMPATAREMGVTDRTDPKQGIDGALGYFKKMLNQFGSYDKAAAAYNWGPGNLRKHLAKNDGEINYEQLPKETQRYVPKVTMFDRIGQKVAQAAESLIPSAQAGEMDEYRRQRLRQALGATAPATAAAAPVAAPSGLDTMALGSITSAPDYKAPPVTRAPVAPKIDTTGMSAEQIPAEALTSSYGEQVGNALLTVPRMLGSGLGAIGDFISRDKFFSTGQKPSTAAAVPTAPTTFNPSLERGRPTMFDDPRLVAPIERGRPTYQASEAERLAPTYNDVTGGPPPIEDRSRPAEPEKPRGLASMTSDDWMNLGFGLLGAKGQNAFQDLGEAGLGMLKARQERAKTEREIEAAKGLRALQEAQMDQARAYAELARKKPAMAADALEQRWAALDAANQAKLRAAYDKDTMAQIKGTTFAEWLASKGPAYMGEDAGTITPTPTAGGATGTGQWGPLQVH